MKRVLLSMTAIAAIAVASQAAYAADMPVRQSLPQQMPVKAMPPIFNWSGFYVGAHGGYGWGRSQFDATTAGTGTFDADGWLFGGLVGVNYQVGQTVFGLETDINWSDMGGSAACGATSCETDVPWFGTARARLGYAVDRFMPYVTGGLAYGKVEANVPGVGSESDTRIGWTAGVGAEYAFTENMSWKTEYLYMDLGSFDCSSCGAPTPSVDFKAHTVRTGINVRF
jgi:outer membrane immunogenic protein